MNRTQWFVFGIGLIVSGFIFSYRLMNSGLYDDATAIFLQSSIIMVIIGILFFVAGVFERNK